MQDKSGNQMPEKRTAGEKEHGIQEVWGSPVPSRSPTKTYLFLLAVLAGPQGKLAFCHRFNEALMLHLCLLLALLEFRCLLPVESENSKKLWQSEILY